MRSIRLNANNTYVKIILKSLNSMPLCGVTSFEASQKVFKMHERPSKPKEEKFINSVPNGVNSMLRHHVGLSILRACHKLLVFVFCVSVASVVRDQC